jgi:VRR-NUC domain
MNKHSFNPLLLQQSEADIQKASVKWFDFQYPHFSRLLFHIPNGGRRQMTQVRDRFGNARNVPIEAKNLKDMGVRRGVSDLFLSVPSGKYHGCYIEMKSYKGTTTKEQKEFLAMVGAQGYKWYIVKSLDEFTTAVKEYLSQEKHPLKSFPTTKT